MNLSAMRKLILLSRIDLEIKDKHNGKAIVLIGLILKSDIRAFESIWEDDFARHYQRRDSWQIC